MVIAISINQTLKLCHCSECLFQALAALSSNVYERLVPLLCRFVCFGFCSEMLLAKLLLVTGTQVSPPPPPSALHWLCSFITSQDFNIRLAFQFLVQAATRRVWFAQDRDTFLETLEEPCPRREGSFEPGLKSGSCPEPRE